VRDQDKTREQLVDELAALRRELAELEAREWEPVLSDAREIDVPDVDLPIFDEWEQEEDREFPEIEEALPAEANEVVDWGPEDLTVTGSFNLKRVRRSSFAKLLNALPIPALLIGRSHTVFFANRACRSVGCDPSHVEGASVISFFPGQIEATRFQEHLRQVFSERKPRVVEESIRLGKSKIFGRLHLRSLRTMFRRAVLLLVEDLTVENRQLVVEQEYQAELLRAYEELKWEMVQREQAEEALAEKERLYRTLIETAKDVIWTVDLDLNYTYVSPSIADVLGYTVDEIMALKPLDTLTPASRHRIALAFAEEMALESNGPRESFTARSEELEHYHKDGSTRWLEITTTFMRDDRGRPTGILRISRDITGRKGSEKTLRLTQFTLDKASVGAVWLDPTGRLFYANEAVSRSLGYSHEELLSLSVHDINPTASPEAWSDYWQRVKERGSVTFESVLRAKDGRVFPVEVGINHLEYDGKEYHCCFAVDITDRKRAEESLRESEEQFFRVFRASPEALVVARLYDGKFVEVNPAFCKEFGYSESEALGKSPVDLNLWHEPDDRKTSFRKLKEQGQLRDVEAKLRRKDGAITDNLLSARIIDYKGEKSIVAFIKDISDRKRAEEQVKASLEEKEVLLREVHHRVKNNLQIMASLLKLQARSIHDETYKGLFKDAESRVRSMDLVHELLYRSDNLAELHVGRYVERLVDHLVGAHAASGARISVRKDIEKVSFGVDTAMPLGFVITELVSNCMKHAFPDEREGEVRISLRSIGDQEFELVVSDNGVGMNRASDPADSESLGLNLVNTFTEKLNGQIEVHSIEGTEFRIRFREVKSLSMK